MSTWTAARKVFTGDSLAKTIMRTSFNNFFVLIVTTLTSILTARMLGVEGKGELAAVLRDTRSYQWAKEKLHQCSITLCPNMEHQLWPLKPTTETVKDVLYFLRTDIETVGGQKQFDDEADAAHRLDWDTLFTPLEVKGIVYFQKFYRLDKKIGGPLPMRTFWYKYTDHLMNKAVTLFSSYREVRTSRLHGHILACLLDMPHVVIDNSYGKNSQYYNTWTQPNPKAKLFNDTPDALEQPS